eukprot:scaffold51915_cov61-Attheya_sp.AAC.2
MTSVSEEQGDNMAPVFFIYLMNALAETLSDKDRHFNKLEYNWFPESSNGNKRWRLMGQSPKVMGSKFDLFYFLYINNDNGAMLFKNRKDLEDGTRLIMDPFARFGLEIHIRRGDKASKTEYVYFPELDHT